MQIQPRLIAPATASQLRAQAPETPPEVPDWRVDAVGAALGGTSMAVAGFYGGLNAGVMLAAGRTAGHPITQLIGVLALGPVYGLYGAMIGTMLGSAVGAGVGIAVARYLAQPD